MKKYVKPDLKYEDFTLSHSIASCNVADDDSNNDGIFDGANSQSAENCTYDLYSLGEIILFTTATNGNCEVDIGLYEDYCYQTGSAGNNLFRS